MAKETSPYVLEVEWRGVALTLANDPKPSSQVVRVEFSSLQDAFNMLSKIHENIFDPAKAKALNLPAFIHSVSLYENEQLLLHRKHLQQGQDSALQFGTNIMIPAKLLSEDVLKAIGGGLSVQKTERGYFFYTGTGADQQPAKRKRVQPPVADTKKNSPKKRR